jgi:hypothetical protein
MLQRAEHVLYCNMRARCPELVLQSLHTRRFDGKLEISEMEALIVSGKL